MKNINPSLYRSYITLVLSIVLLAIAGQWMIHAHLRDFDRDGVRINLAGKQRMISQLIVKKIALSELGLEQSQPEWKSLLMNFQAVHVALKIGDNDLRLPVLSDEGLQAQYQITDEKFRAFFKLLPENIKTDISINNLREINEAQEGFLIEMDRFVFASSDKMESKVNQFQWIEMIIAIFSFVLILVELIVVFIPALRFISNQNEKLKITSFYYSHIFRRPVANILALLQLTIKEGGLTERQEKNLQLIEKEGKELDEIIKDRVKESEKS